MFNVLLFYQPHPKTAAYIVRRCFLIYCKKQLIGKFMSAIMTILYEINGGVNMPNVDFCTCINTACPHHPRQTGSCTNCIQKNLNHGEIPSCFFDKIDGVKKRSNYKFEDFAKLVLEQQEIEHNVV